MSTIADWNLDACDCGLPGSLLDRPVNQITLTCNPPIFQYQRACRACGQFWNFSRSSDWLGSGTRKTKAKVAP